LVDVGGGTGNTAKIICETFPELKYIVLDLPQVVLGLAGSNNLSFVGGNMFKSIPQADAVLLKVIDDTFFLVLIRC
jgi:ubiquinone/menaquinone biosynthesis C-methylase UbiE